MKWQCVFIFSILTSTCAFDCPEGDGCSRCRKRFDNVYELNCATMRNSVIEVQIRPDNYVRLTCRNSANWTKFNLGWSQPVARVKAMSFDMCNFPGSNDLEIITKRLLVDEVEVLSFRSNGKEGSTITKDSLRGLDGLKELTLAVDLTNVGEDLFENLTNLTKLNLQNSNLRHLPNHFFRSSNLEAIELSTNDLEELDSRPFDKLGRLRLLNIWNNKIVKIYPKTFDKLVSLETLNLRGNRLKSLPRFIFHRLDNLRILRLSENNFTLDSLPSDLLKNCSNLQTLELVQNRRNMTTLPKEFFSNLTNLKTIKLRKIGLSSLPEDLFRGATNLQNVSIERNYLQTLPNKIFQDTRDLLTLDLNFNDLLFLPEDVFINLQKLVKLDLSRNHLTTISEKLFTGLTSLRELNMERNDLTSVHFNAFESLQKLRVAKFSYNSLTLENLQRKLESPFHYSEELEELYLDHNNISDICVDWMYSMSFIKILNLSYNRLQYLMHEDLQFLSQDLYVDLTHNDISHVYLKDVETWAAERTYSRNLIVSIEDNPIECDCDLYDLLRYAEGRMRENVKNAFKLKMEGMKCNGPEELKNTAITSLESKTLKCEAKTTEFGGSCPNECRCYTRPENKACLVDCSNENLTEPPLRIDCPSDHSIELNLSNNSLTILPNLHQPGYEKVTVLALEHNEISRISVERLSSRLKVLKLNDNRLSRLDEAVIDFLNDSTELRELALESNPWLCDCEARDLLNFIQSKHITLPDLLKVKCPGRELPIYEMTPEDLCPSNLAWIIGGCFGLAFLGIIVGLLAALYYRYQREIKIWLYAKNWCLWFVTEDELDKEKLFDAFISYSHNDEDFVVNDLIPNLESGPRPFKLCVHFRDWMAGEWIPKQIARSVEESRRTIVVLSPNFLESVWGRMEFRAAHSQALSEGRARVIVILYGEIEPDDDLDPELKAYLSMNTYVKWGDPWFWQKLKYALPHPPEFTKRKLRKNIFETTQLSIDVMNDKSELIDPTGFPTTPPIPTTPPPDSVEISIDDDVPTKEFHHVKT